MGFNFNGTGCIHIGIIDIAGYIAVNAIAHNQTAKGHRVRVAEAEAKTGNQAVGIRFAHRQPAPHVGVILIGQIDAVLVGADIHIAFSGLTVQLLP